MGVNSVPEELLWERSLAGDGAAFGRIFDMHRDRVFTHCFRLLQTSHDAEDATAIAFFELWRRREKVRQVDGSVLPWLLVTATNSCRNLARSRRRYERFLKELPRSPAEQSAEDQADLDPDFSPELVDALGQLGDADARLFSLIALQGFTPAEAAAVLGSTSGAVRTRLHRIRARLQQRLGHTSFSDYLAEEPA